jgi:flagellar hook protein FlgE
MSNSNYAISLSGLQNTAKAIDTVSNNIANANTVGYKAGEYVFADQFLKAINPVDFARVGMGSQTLGVRRPNVQGTIVNSANPLDLAISGKGMFRLVAAISSNISNNGGPPAVDPAAVYYSRNGQFGLDKDGYIVNENGMYLTGYQPTGDGTGITDSYLVNNGLLKMPPANLPGRETTKTKIGALLDSSGSAFTKTSGVEFDPTQNTFNNKTTQTVFDYEGNRRTLELYYRRITDSKVVMTYADQGGGVGYQLTYPPGVSSTPGNPGETAITINKFSVMRIDTAAEYTNSAEEAVNSTNIVTLTNDLGANDIAVGMRVWVNGRDTGVSVSSFNAATDAVTLSASVDIPKGASVSFYPPYKSKTVDGAALATASGFNFDGSVVAPNNVIAGTLEGYRLFVNNVDTGLNVTSNTPTGVTLDGTLASGGLATGLADNVVVEFRPVHDMTLVTPDGTEITVQGTTNDLSPDAGNWKFLATASNVEVYASIDGNFYDRAGEAGDPTSNRGLSPEITNTVLGYNPVSMMTFLGGKNIDSLIKDPVSGNPVFKTTTTLSTKVTGVGTGVTDLVFELDLTDTSLQPAAFQITSSVQNGEPLARLSNVTIDNSGRIVGVYGTGKQVFVGQLVLADFTAFEELVPVGKNAFAPTAASGTEASSSGVVIGRAGTGPFGEIKSQALESSNVDLANELVRLMIMQRSYTANSQGLRAVDGTLRDMLDIMR